MAKVLTIIPIVKGNLPIFVLFKQSMQKIGVTISCHSMGGGITLCHLPLPCD